MNIVIIFAILISFIINITLLYLLIPTFRKHLPDKPNIRSSHIKVKPTGGGIIFVLTSSIFFLINGYNIILGNLLLGIVGFIDDKKNLSSLLRFFLQFLFVNFLIYKSNLFNTFFQNNLLFINIIFWFASNVILIGIINFINFMDGIDGLLAGSMIFIVLTSAIILKLNFYFLISALVAFLIWNWYPSKIFMGDAGSTFLGGFLALSLTNTPSFEESLLIFISSTPLLLDALTCILRRYFNNQKIFQPHKLHLYQRLHQSGWKHNLVSTLYIFWSIIISISCISKNWSVISISLISMIIFGIFLDKKYAKPFLKKNF